MIFIITEINYNFVALLLWNMPVSPVIIAYSGTVGADEVNQTSSYRISCRATSRLSKQTLVTILYHNWLQVGYHSLRNWMWFPVSVLGLDWGIDGPGALTYSSSDHQECNPCNNLLIGLQIWIWIPDSSWVHANIGVMTN